MNYLENNLVWNYRRKKVGKECTNLDPILSILSNFKRLSKIHLNGKINDKQASIIKISLFENKNIKEIIIEGIFGNKGFEEISQLIEQNSKIKSIHLSGRFDNEGLVKIHETLNGKDNL